jgi:cytochrome bd-type quinol oxidase subunit 2
MFKFRAFCLVIIVLSLIAHTILGVIVLESNRRALTAQCQSSLFFYEIVMTVISSILPLIIIYSVSKYIISKTCNKDIHVDLNVNGNYLRLAMLILLCLVGWSIFIYVNLQMNDCSVYYKDTFPYLLKFFYATFWYYISLIGFAICGCIYCYLKVQYLIYEAKNTAVKEANQAFDQEPQSSLRNSGIPRLDYYQSQDTISRLQPQFSADVIPHEFVEVDLHN